MRETIPIVVQSKNEMLRHSGYSPNMWVLGSAGPRLPGAYSTHTKPHASRYRRQPTTPSPRWVAPWPHARRHDLRLCVLTTAHATDEHSYERVCHREAPYPLGCYVYFRRSAVRKGETAAPGMRWFGPARVIGHEGASNATMGANVNPGHAEKGISHGIWLRYQNTSILASPEQLQFASDDELLAFNILRSDDLPQRAGPKSHIDVRSDVLQIPVQPVADLPGGPAAASTSIFDFVATAAAAQVPPTATDAPKNIMQQSIALEPRSAEQEQKLAADAQPPHTPRNSTPQLGDGSAEPPQTITAELAERQPDRSPHQRSPQPARVVR